MANVFTVRDDVSRYGLRRVHLIRAGKRVNEAAWLEENGISEELLLAKLVYEEEDTGMWHLRLYWKEGSVVNGQESNKGTTT